MKIFFLCDPKRNTTCSAVCRVEGDTVACLNPRCKTTSKVKAARRIIGIPLVDVPFTIRDIIDNRRLRAEGDVQSESQ